MKQFWEDRYKEAEYAYGIHPNDFFSECLAVRKPGNLLLPAEGEGRNAVFASLKGWDVEAFDYSAEGQKKALDLGKGREVSFSYSVNDYDSFTPKNSPFDLIALIYTHSDPKTRSVFNQKLIHWLAPGGEIILEGFSKNQLGKKSGGPKAAAMLWSIDELEKDFESLSINYKEELNIKLNEGSYHQGEASVVRLIISKE